MGQKYREGRLSLTGFVKEVDVGTADRRIELVEAVDERRGPFIKEIACPARGDLDFDPAKPLMTAVGLLGALLLWISARTVAAGPVAA
jgi:hypothetical protein